MKSYTNVGEVWFHVPYKEIYMVVREGRSGDALCLSHSDSERIGILHRWNTEIDLLNCYVSYEWNRIV